MTVTVNGCTSSAGTTSVTVDQSPPPPSVGNTVLADKTGGVNHLTWPAIAGALTYHVWRDTQPNMSTMTLVAVTASLSWNDPVLGDGVNYYYWVRAANCSEGP